MLLALEHKRLPYVSHLLQFSKQEHKSPHMLSLNPRGKVPVLKDGDYVCFESLAILYYLDLKYPEPPIFGRTPEEAGTIMRVICEYQAYIEPHVNTIVRAVFAGKGGAGGDEITAAMHAAASEARTIEGRLSKSDWIVGEYVLGGRHGDLPGHPAAAARAGEAARHASCPRASCRWRSTIRHLDAGWRASRRCPATSVPIRRTGAAPDCGRRRPPVRKIEPR